MVVLLLLTLQAAPEQDPRARAVREAYEEQLRRDRQVITIRIREPLDSISADQGFESLDHNGAIGLLSLWISGEKAYPELVERLDQPELDRARTATRVLNLLTGRRAPLPEAETRRRLKRDWETWLRDPTPACSHAEHALPRLLQDLGAEEIEVRRDAEGILAACAPRHAALSKDARERATDVELRARLGSLIATSDRSSLRPDDIHVLEKALSWVQTGADAPALLRAERGRFRCRHRATLDVVLAALQK